jgi:hypothetical protein
LSKIVDALAADDAILYPFSDLQAHLLCVYSSEISAKDYNLAPGNESRDFHSTSAPILTREKLISTHVTYFQSARRVCVRVM